jgi:hypothetical protein
MDNIASQKIHRCMRLIMSYGDDSLTISKLNVVAFVKEEENSMSTERPSSWVEIVSQQAVIDGWK